MKCKKLFQTTATVLILTLLFMCGTIGVVYSTDEGDPNGNLTQVNVTDYGAKSFTEPVECELNGTDTIVATGSIGDLSEGDTVKIINGGSSDADLTATITAINSNSITLDTACGSTITTKVYIDSTQAFMKAFDYANENNYDVIIPAGNYYIDGTIYIQTNVKCEGKLYTSNKYDDPLFDITRGENPTEISGSSIEGNLEAGTEVIPELAAYKGYDVVFYSGEPTSIYYQEKIVTNRIVDNNGSLMVPLSESYTEKSELILYLYKGETPITLEGLDILCIDGIKDKYKTIVGVSRSDVTFEGFSISTENFDPENLDQYTGLGLQGVVNINLNNPKFTQGIGYPVVAYFTLRLTLNNPEIGKARYAVSCRYDNYTTINGGAYEDQYDGYGVGISSDWGHNYTVNNAVIKGNIGFAGENLTINGCDITTSHPTLIARSLASPSIKGNVEINNTTVKYTGYADFSIYKAEYLTKELGYQMEEYNNPNLLIKNMELVVENDLPIIDLYDIDHGPNPFNSYEPEMQILPETIRVEDLHITGNNDSKLENTHFRMMAATSKYYYGGNPEVSLQNITINRDTESDTGLNYDGKIAYSFHPAHVESEVPDTHYKMTAKDCGTLSVNIVPTILGDMVIENCSLIDYIYAGDIINDWPNNPVWWYKGTGKTVFKDVKFDRTGLFSSSISVMNDAEFERCEFTNYGTIDYMNFGDELPTVQILRVQDCIFNEGGITGGSLSEQLISGDLLVVDVTDYGAKSFTESVECELNGTDTIVATGSIGDLSEGDTVKIINGGSSGADLTATITAINSNSITLDTACGSTITTKVYIDSTQAFKDAFNYANSNNYDVIIPEGNYYIDNDIYIQTNVKCLGKLYTSNKGNVPLFYITRKETKVEIGGNSIEGSLEAGTMKIPELENYVDHDVIFNSQERIMWRNNNPGEFYTKNEANRVGSDGSLMVGLSESYNDKSLLSVKLYKKERPITLEGLNILCIDNTITNHGKNIVEVKRSDVTFEELILDNENLSKEEGQNTGIAITDAVNVTFNNSKIRGFMLNGLGYGVLVYTTLNVTLNNTDISKTRHAIAGRHDIYTTINGGSYEAYGGTLDSHWGYNFMVKNATIMGEHAAFGYSGQNLSIDKCNIITDHSLLVDRNMDTPSIKGNVEIKDTTVTYTGSSDFMFYCSYLTDYEHDAQIYNPNLIIENIELVLANDIPVVEIYAIEHNLDKQYIMQKLPETINVKKLHIIGNNDSKLENTHFRMMAATSKYYTGNPEIYLENIRVNRDIESEDSLNYDGEISYSFYLEHTEAEVPDTHYKMTIKDCGTLSVNIVPTILGDMVIENCNIIDYIYAGDIINDWPNNPVWWYKGTGKTVFKDVQFDRTGLPASSISVMNDAEFERCEFTNYGTIDYMDFGDELPTVQILRVEDCIINEGGITGGSLSEQLLSGDLFVVDVTDYGAKSFTEPVECELNGTDTIVATGSIGDLSEGDTVKIINGGSSGADLTATITAINSNSITLDTACGSTITTKVYIDSTQAFMKAFDYANENNYDVIIPAGNYYIDGTIYIQTNVKCEGKLYTSNKYTSAEGYELPLLYIRRGENPTEISGSSIEGNLEAGTEVIPELAAYKGYDVVFYSGEPTSIYYQEKIVTNRIVDNNGSLMVPLSESYTEKSELILYLYKGETPITLEGLDILCIDGIKDKYKTIVGVSRSDVTFEGFSISTENFDPENLDQYTGLGLQGVVNINLNNPKFTQGIGYPVVAYFTLRLTLNNPEIGKARYAVSCRYDNYTTINGGAYEDQYDGYGVGISSDWGHNYTVNNAVIKGNIGFAGENLTINGCDITTSHPTLIARSLASPSIKGNVEINNTTVKYTGYADFSIYKAEYLTKELGYQMEEYNNPNLLIKNMELVVENDLPIIDLYDIDHGPNPFNSYEPEMQILPETIRVEDLHITGNNDSKLENTHFRMMAATSKYYYGGNPEVSLQNITINRDTESDTGLNYDGKIAYSFHPAHVESEVPDTHYKMTAKDCGTLSVNIVPTILGDMVIENCSLIDYIYAGDIINDWPNNPVWWYKGTGKTVFKDVKFDRTGLFSSSISVMNDAEFERCEFTNYGTIDYMNFGDELPTVQILRVQDCIFNEGGITGGSLSRFLLPLIVEELMFTDLNGTKITKLVGDTDIKASVKITSNTEKTMPVVIILALYDENDRIANFSMASQDISEETEVTLATGFRLPLNIDGYKVKAFIWDSWETMKPLSNRVIFP